MTTRHLLTTRASVLADKRQVRCICSTESLGRDNLIVISRGIDLTNYKLNPVVLWQHCADWPVARAVSVGVEGTNLIATVQFPDQGESPKADEVYGLIKAGVVNAVSIGFETRSAQPIDPTKPRDGDKITACELQEFSFVSIPALPDALVTERSHRAAKATRQTGRLQRQRQAARYAAELGEAPPVRRAAPERKAMSFHRRMAILYAAQVAKR